MYVEQMDRSAAGEIVTDRHYLRRRPQIKFAYGLFLDFFSIAGVVTFGYPVSKCVQKSACADRPDTVIELNRLWVCDSQPRNTETWFLSRALKRMPPRIVVSYADIDHGHPGYVYRAANFNYAGETVRRYDKSARGLHPRARNRVDSDDLEKVWRNMKLRYWTVTGNRRERHEMDRLCSWPKLSWKK